MTANNFDLKRFLDAQEKSYSTALAELQAGQEKSHWIWYIFPQLKGLGRSHNAEFYGLKGLAEAKAYLANPILGQRLKTAVDALLTHKDKNINAILGDIDALKFRSCLTLFSLAAPDEQLFANALSCFFAGKSDSQTIDLLEVQH